MSEWSTIYDAQENIVGTFRHGVAWCKKTGQRLGSYDDEHIYNNQGQAIAKIEQNTVTSNSGNVLGKIVGNKIIVSGNPVGRFTGLNQAAAAAIPFIFNQNVV